MSKATKRKHVTREVETELTLPQEGQSIVKVEIQYSVKPWRSYGNLYHCSIDCHLIIYSEADSMPKFFKVVFK